MNTPIDENKITKSFQGGDKSSSPETAIPPSNTNTTAPITDEPNIVDPDQDNWGFDEPVRINVDTAKLDNFYNSIKEDPEGISDYLTGNPNRARELAGALGFGENNAPAVRQIIKGIASQDSRFQSTLSTNTDSWIGKGIAKSRNVLDAVMNFSNYTIGGYALSDWLIGAGTVFQFSPWGIVAKLGTLAIVSGMGTKAVGWFTQGVLANFNRENSEQFLPDHDFKKEASNTAFTTTAGIVALTGIMKKNQQALHEDARANHGMSRDTSFYNYNRRGGTINYRTGDLDEGDDYDYIVPKPRPSRGRPSASVRQAREFRDSIVRKMSEEAQRRETTARTSTADIQQSNTSYNQKAQDIVNVQRDAYRSFWQSDENPLRGRQEMSKSEYWNYLNDFERIIKHHPLNSTNADYYLPNIANKREYHIKKIQQSAKPNTKPQFTDVEYNPQYTHVDNSHDFRKFDLELGGEPVPMITKVSNQGHIPYSRTTKNKDLKTLAPVGFGGLVKDNVASWVAKRGVAIYPKFEEVSNNIGAVKEYIQASIDANDSSDDLGTDKFSTFREKPISGAVPYNRNMSLSNALSNVLDENVPAKVSFSALPLDITRNGLSKLGKTGKGTIGSVATVVVKKSLGEVTKFSEPRNFHDVNLEELVDTADLNGNDVLLTIDPLNPTQQSLVYKDGMYRVRKMMNEHSQYDFKSGFETLKKEGSTGAIRELYENSMFKAYKNAIKGTMREKDLRSAIVVLVNNSRYRNEISGETVGKTDVNYGLHQKMLALMQKPMEDRIGGLNSGNRLTYNLAIQLRSILLDSANSVENPLLIDPVDIYRISHIPIPNIDNIDKVSFDEGDLTEEQWDDILEQDLAYELMLHVSTLPTVYGDTHNTDGVLTTTPSLRELSLLSISGSDVSIKVHRPKSATLHDMNLISKLNSEYEFKNSLVTKANGYFVFPKPIKTGEDRDNIPVPMINNGALIRKKKRLKNNKVVDNKDDVNLN